MKTHENVVFKVSFANATFTVIVIYKISISFNDYLVNITKIYVNFIKSNVTISKLLIHFNKVQIKFDFFGVL